MKNKKYYEALSLDIVTTESVGEVRYDLKLNTEVLQITKEQAKEICEMFNHLLNGYLYNTTGIVYNEPKNEKS